MTAKEIIEMFCQLPREEQDKVIAYFLGAETMPGFSPASPNVTAAFRAISSEVFATNNELFKKLAS